MSTLRFDTEQDYQAFLAARQSREKRPLAPRPATIAHKNTHNHEDKAVTLLRAIVDAKLVGTWYREFTFHESRGWRLDVACPEKKLSIEVNGSVHRIKDKFLRDMERHNALILAGWRYLICTPAQVDSGYAIVLLKMLLQEIGP